MYSNRVFISAGVADCLYLVTGCRSGLTGCDVRIVDRYWHFRGTLCLQLRESTEDETQRVPPKRRCLFIQLHCSTS